MNTTPKKNYTLPIVMMFFLFFMISFVTGLQNPMGVIVKNQFHLSNFLSQLGNACNFIAYAFMGIPAGMMLKRKGYKFTALAAIAVGFIGVGISLISGYIYNPAANNGTFTFIVYLFGAFVSGFSMCMLNTVVNPMLNTLGGGGNKGNQLIQFGGSINSIGATIVPVFVGYLMGNDVSKSTIGDCRPALLIAMGIFALAFIVFIFFKLPEPHIEAKGAVKEKDPHGPFSFRHFILGIVAIFIYVGVEVGIPNILNQFLTGSTHGGININATVAGTIVGTYWFLMLCGRLIGASIGAKVSSKIMLSFTTVVGIILVLFAIFTPTTTMVSMPVFQSDISFGLAQVPLSVMLIVLCGLCTSVMWGGIFNLAVEGLGKYTPAASGIFMVMVCGGGILPLIQGAIADSTSYISSYWVIIAGMAYMLFYALVGSKNVNKDIKTE